MKKWKGLRIGGYLNESSQKVVAPPEDVSIQWLHLQCFSWLTEIEQSWMWSCEKAAKDHLRHHYCRLLHPYGMRRVHHLEVLRPHRHLLLLPQQILLDEEERWSKKEVVGQQQQQFSPPSHSRGLLRGCK